ncbi:M24 family metallopeptidase [Salinicola avicenniae]|uniref:M24 family metallopeptidase n=1 Tax=Salinicola avicenniae TaxID=2916836 RepID=UPI0020741070|nr:MULTISPECIES: M24 family metallopeptidase [unclassified Salinicola]
MSERLTTLRERLRDWRLDGVLLSSRESVAWLTQGATYHVVERSAVGVASLLVTPEQVYLVAPDNEIDRLREEEPHPFEVVAATYAWYETADVALARLGFDGSASRLGSDLPMTGATCIAEHLLPLRFELDALERERLSRLGQDAAGIVETIAANLRPGEREIDIEARILHDCLEAGIRPVCTLVAFDARIDRYPHPIPTDARLSQRALLTLGAERDGLNVSLTRMVRFGEVEAALLARYRQAAAIHAETLAAVRPGLSWEALFATISEAYERQGHTQGWRRHHQGGPAGYGCRDLILTPTARGQSVAHQAFAFNPTLPGVKSEDTLLLDGGGGRLVTRTGDWPTLEFDAGGRTWSLAGWLARE